MSRLFTSAGAESPTLIGLFLLLFSFSAALELVIDLDFSFSQRQMFRSSSRSSSFFQLTGRSFFFFL